MIVKRIQNLGNRMQKIQETFHKDLEELKSKQKMKNTINEIKVFLEGNNRRITEAEEQISDLEDTIVEIITAEQNKEKNRMKRIEDSLRGLWDNIKCTNVPIIGVPEEE